MAKRLQLILKDTEYRQVRRAAHSRSISVAEWVRQALNVALRREPVGDINKKLNALRAAMKFEFPTGDTHEMLAEIEQSYLPDDKKSS